MYIYYGLLVLLIRRKAHARLRYDSSDSTVLIDELFALIGSYVNGITSGHSIILTLINKHKSYVNLHIKFVIANLLFSFIAHMLSKCMYVNTGIPILSECRDTLSFLMLGR
jgi:hypothetical protein